MKKRCVYGIFLLGLAAAILSAQSGYPRAPEFSLKGLDGTTVSLADMRGKVVFINFWATWCPPCREEIPDFVEFYSQNKSRGVEIVGLSVDRLSPEDLRAFVLKNKMSYPVALATQKIIRDYQPGPYIPTTIVIDKQGRIRDKQVGSVDKATLADWFQKLSSEK
jgi:peroxiredoxin